MIKVDFYSAALVHFGCKQTRLDDGVYSTDKYRQGNRPKEEGDSGVTAISDGEEAHRLATGVGDGEAHSLITP